MTRHEFKLNQPVELDSSEGDKIMTYQDAEFPITPKKPTPYIKDAVTENKASVA